MRDFVREGLSGQFLDRDGHWTKSMRQAREFEKSHEAIEAALGMGVEDLEIVLSFADSALDVRIPLKTIPSLKAASMAKQGENQVAAAA